MSGKLSLSVILIATLLLIYIVRDIKRGELNIKNSVLWIILDIAVIVCTFSMKALRAAADFFGVEVVSNLLFFMALIFLFIVAYNLTKKISAQNKRILTLTQELALLRKDIDENEDSK